MRYTIEYRVKGKHQKEFIEGRIKLPSLQQISTFIERMKRKYEVCEFKKYDNNILVSTF
ncbi:hypothetical protein [Elizabethkingia anophelis]|uniref:hypothetical protein n=1 Tax=Elizabethkingia anophelis TaxID=1117645 RepID=UPI001685E04E|nr:hypothetical protein [Elizabethkingia anophelis]UTF89402.1 hypothetical protein J2N93_18885 [Elizabethkingia anophelis]UTG53876.1 hypothetical protein J2O05_18870 [Elizabethkingia anophelis]